MASVFSLLAYAVATPVALAGFVRLFGAYWPLALVVLVACVGMCRLGRAAAPLKPD